MDLPHLVCLSVVVILCTAYALQRRRTTQLSKLLRSKEDELAAAKADKSQSIELSEFLYDQSRYGYSFVRVDPASVMIRSPRDR
jgi:hypothetical protein